ncbi:Hypothetical protein DHA2_150120 [Giardia duodenalis]|uniref:Uncharacterized protein n=1 Tax=Giardia intestinalis TaxID=5741 RepID=V6TKS5_GIAIN|nr:Hypothetical protein DHA2_150120 [Giardia intestinalis]
MYGGGIDDPVPLLKRLLLDKYLPLVNPILAETGVALMNGNFIDYATIDTVYLCSEDRVLFVADIEKNRYFS